MTFPPFLRETVRVPFSSLVACGAVTFTFAPSTAVVKWLLSAAASTVTPSDEVISTATDFSPPAAVKSRFSGESLAMKGTASGSFSIETGIISSLVAFPVTKPFTLTCFPLNSVTSEASSFREPCLSVPFTKIFTYLPSITRYPDSSTGSLLRRSLEARMASRLWASSALKVGARGWICAADAVRVAFLSSMTEPYLSIVPSTRYVFPTTAL